MALASRHMALGLVLKGSGLESCVDNFWIIIVIIIN